MTVEQTKFQAEDFDQAKEVEATMLTDPDQSFDVECDNCSARFDLGGGDLTNQHFKCHECGAEYTVSSHKVWAHSLSRVD